MAFGSLQSLKLQPPVNNILLIYYYISRGADGETQTLKIWQCLLQLARLPILSHSHSYTNKYLDENKLRFVLHQLCLIGQF